jgi:uncharacterized protein
MQNITENRLSVSGTATIQLPVDQIHFSLHISEHHETSAEGAFELHKKAENTIAKFLKTNAVPEKQIQYQLISISQQQDYNADPSGQKLYFITQQSIQFWVKDLTAYSSFFIKLLSLGFTNINASFSSSEEGDCGAALIKKAILSAKLKAEVMAKVSERSLGKILLVSDTDTESQHGHDPRAFAKMASFDESDITSIPQTIEKSYSLKVLFELI